MTVSDQSSGSFHASYHLREHQRRRRQNNCCVAAGVRTGPARVAALRDRYRSATLDIPLARKADAKVEFSVITYVTATTLQQHVLDSRRAFDHVLIDLPGAQSPLLATAIGLF